MKFINFTLADTNEQIALILNRIDSIQEVPNVDNTIIYYNHIDGTNTKYQVATKFDVVLARLNICSKEVYK